MINNFIHPQTWLDWILIYLVIGGTIVFGIIYNQVNKMPSSFARNLMRSIGYKKTAKEIFQDWLVYTLAALLVLIAWPFFLGWLIHDKKQRRKDLEWQNKSRFKSAHQYLTAQVTKEFAESDNLIFDPLGYTPNVPFGYLNKAWHMFLNSKLENDELWYFKIPKGKPVGKYGLETNAEINGIALLRDKEIIDEFFITSD